MFKSIQFSFFPLLFIVLNLATDVFAGTVIKIQDGNEVTTMFTDGRRARINMSADEYVIFDFASQKIKMVNPQKKQLMVFNAKRNNQYSTGSSSALVKLSLKSRGRVKNIAGYQSEEYEYTANGQFCGVLFASKSALREKGVKELLDAMQAMIDQQRDVLGGFAALIDDCKLADMQLTEEFSKIGVPMQKLDNGRVTTQVKSIDVDVSLPSAAFVVPASYKNTTLEEQVQQAYKGLSPTASGATSQSTPRPAPQGASNQKQMQSMMQQMQRSGQLTPEMIEQMRSAERMMRQYQRPGY